MEQESDLARRQEAQDRTGAQTERDQFVVIERVGDKSRDVEVRLR